MKLLRWDERADDREVQGYRAQQRSDPCPQDPPSADGGGKGLGSRFGGCAVTAVELASGDLRRVSTSGLSPP